MAAAKGFTPVPCDADKLKPRYNEADCPALDYDKDLVPLTPSTELTKAAVAFLKPRLASNVFNHSHRAFYLSVAIAKTQFPDWDFDAESYFLACLFHDYGCTPENIKATKLSFESYGGILAREWLLEHKASQDQADSVAETIFRHTDFVKGSILLHGQMIQLGTLLDNHGARSYLINRKTVDSIVTAWPRLEWNEGFAAAMEAEADAKPWSHTTCFEGAIWQNSRNNEYMKQYEH